MSTPKAIRAVLLVAPAFAAVDEVLNVCIGQGQLPFADEDSTDCGGVDLMDELCRRLQRECRFHSVPWKRCRWW